MHQGCKNRCIRSPRRSKKRKTFVENISNVTFNDLPNLRRKYQRVTLNQTFLDAGSDVKGNCSNDKVFRFSDEGIYKLQGVYSEPKREASEPKLNGLWQEFSKKAAEEHILNGGSLLVKGSPGTGKTFYVRQLVTKLRNPCCGSKFWRRSSNSRSLDLSACKKRKSKLQGFSHR